MNGDMSDNNPTDNEILSMIDKLLPDSSDSEREDIYSHIYKQIKNFKVLDNIDTSNAEPLFNVIENNSMRRGA